MKGFIVSDVRDFTPRRIWLMENVFIIRARKFKK